jgi:hypothetical protein
MSGRADVGAKRAALVALADDLKQQVGAALVDGQISDFIQRKNLRNSKTRIAPVSQLTVPRQMHMLPQLAYEMLRTHHFHFNMAADPLPSGTQSKSPRLCPGRGAEAGID